MNQERFDYWISQIEYCFSSQYKGLLDESINEPGRENLRAVLSEILKEEREDTDLSKISTAALAETIHKAIEILDGALNG